MARMIRAIRIGPKIAYVDITKAFQGSCLGWSQIAQGVDRLIRRLRVLYAHARPVCKQADTPVNLRRYPAFSEDAAPPDAKEKQSNESQQDDATQRQANILGPWHLSLR